MYLPPDIVTSEGYKDVDHVDRDLQVSDLDLSIGTRCRSLLVSLEEESMSPQDVQEFFGFVS